MKKILNIFGNTGDITTGMLLAVLGMIIVCGFDVGLKTLDGATSWMALNEIPRWVGWALIYIGFDSFFGGRITKLASAKVLQPVFLPVIRGIIGDDRLEKLKGKLGQYGRKHEDTLED